MAVSDQCSICGKAVSGPPRWSIHAGEGLCRACCRRELQQHLREFDAEDWKKARRRTEDCLRKNKKILEETVLSLAEQGMIEVADLG